MLDLREKAVQSLITVDPIRGYIGDRVYQTGTMAIEKPRPFIIARFGLVNDVAWRDGPTSQTVELWVHDEPGDYNRIDQIISLAKSAWHALPNEENFLESRFVSTTPDLQDPELSTIFRVARFMWALST